MFAQFRTLRFKLAALYLLVFGIIQTAMCVGIVLVREQELRRDLDEGLLDRAELIAESIQATEGRTNPSGLFAYSFLNSPRFASHYVRIRGEDGTILGQSVLSEFWSPPWDKPIDLSGPPGAMSFKTYDVETAGTPEPQSKKEKARLLTYLFRAKDDRLYFIQVARSLASMDESVAALRRLIFIAMPQALLASCAAAWWAAKRSLAPIGTIAKEAQKLTATGLNRRIQLPDTRDEVAQMAAVFNELLDRLEQAFNAQEQFIADVSHELKTPLAVLLGEAEVLLKRERTTQEYVRFVDSVHDEMSRLTRIVHSLLMLARADSGLPLPDASPISVNEVVADTVQRCEPSAVERKINLVPHLMMPDEEEGEPIVMGDADLLGAVLMNLVRNAIRFSPLGGRVDIRVDGTPGEVCITVRDHGPGIPPQYIDKVFTRFFRLPEEGGRLPGTGLGLSIARGMVQLHGGKIRATTPKDGGCELVVQLPRATEEILVE